MQPPDLHHCDRQDILAYFQRAWQIEDQLMKSLTSPQTFYLNPDPLRNLLIFYLGHSAVFYINKLVRVDLFTQRINPHFESLFEIGVDPEKPEEIASIFDNLRQVDVADVWAYRQQVHDRVSEFINNLAIALPISPAHPLWALMMAIEHQYIHIETSSMLIRQLPVETLQRPEGWQYAPANGYTKPNEMIEITGGTVRFGKPQDSRIYGWDIEYGDRTVNVATFQASKYLITNAEFLEFVKDGGYENQNYWHESAWQWKIQHNIKHPKFWIPLNNQQPDEYPQYKYRAMFDEIDMPFDFPVEVNHHEAIAYCRWKGNNFRLMSEAEYNLATYGTSGLLSPQATDNSNFNLNLKFSSPSPVGYLETSPSPSGLSDLRGNVWEWLSDHLTPLSGYQSHYLYANYSAPYFDTKHNMMAGGSWITSGTEACQYYRNWFRPHFYQHAGFRIAK